MAQAKGPDTKINAQQKFNEKNLHHSYQKNTTAAWANQQEKLKPSNAALPSEFEVFMAREWVNENQK